MRADKNLVGREGNVIDSEIAPEVLSCPTRGEQSDLISTNEKVDGAIRSVQGTRLNVREDLISLGDVEAARVAGDPVETNELHVNWAVTCNKKNKIKEKQKEYGPCPVCKGSHVWKGRYGLVASQQVTDCKDFRNMDQATRVAAFKKHKLCRRCLSWGHEIDACPRKKGEFKCKKPQAGGDLCGKDHATLLCGAVSCYLSQTTALSNVNSGQCEERGDVMLAIIAVHLGGGLHTNALLDQGSNTSLISHGLAKKLGLRGTSVQQTVELAGKAPEVQRESYLC